MFGTPPRARLATIGTFVTIAILAGACSSSGTASETAPSALPASFETDGLSVTVDDVVSAVATSSREGDATVLRSPTTLDAQVTVADDALPADISGDDVTATVLSFDSEVDGASAITFELGPDGAEFDQPVLLEWEGPWAPSAAYSLAAFHGDGSPVEDTGRTDANSIAALRVEPTSDTTARYTLPVDHFSSWTVSVGVNFGSNSVYSASFRGKNDVRGIVGVDTDATVDVLLYGKQFDAARTQGTYRTCVSGQVVSTDGPLSARFTRSEPTCTQSIFGGADDDLDLTLRCSAAGTGSVTIVAYALLTYERGSGQRGRLGSTELAELKKMMLRYSFELKQLDDDEAAARIDDGTHQGGMFAAQATLAVTCDDEQSTTTTETTPTTTTTLDTETTDSSSSTTTKPATTSSTPSGDSVPPPPTTSADGTPSATTPSPTSAAPVTSAVPTSTSPATSAPGTTPTPTAWGPVGDWAYNEFGSCDYNGTGGCGWYFSRNPGTYTLGPIGSPGATI